MTDSDPKLFLLSGFGAEKAEKAVLERKIRSLGGEVLDQETWNPKCTHVIANDFAKISEKIMAGLAAGRWIVAKSYVEKSHEKGSWENARPYVSHQIILHHKKNWTKLGRAGGCFHGMKAILLLEDEIKCEVYARIIRAGDGVVLEKMTIEMMAERKVDPSSVTHIFLDPTVIHPGHKKHDQFKRWEKFCEESAGKAPWHLHDKFLLYQTRRPVGVELSEKGSSVVCLRERRDSWNVKTPASASCLEWDEEVDMRTPLTKFVWAATTPLFGSPANRLFSWQWDDHHQVDIEEFYTGEEKNEGQGSPISREKDKDGEGSQNTGDYSEEDDVFTSPKIPIKDLDSDTVCNLGLSEWDKL